MHMAYGFSDNIYPSVKKANTFTYTQMHRHLIAAKVPFEVVVTIDVDFRYTKQSLSHPPIMPIVVNTKYCYFDSPSEEDFQIVKENFFVEIL